MDEKSSEVMDQIETSPDKLGENLHDLESRMLTSVILMFLSGPAWGEILPGFRKYAGETNRV